MDTQGVLVKQLEAIWSWNDTLECLQPPPLLFHRVDGDNASQPIDEPDLKAEIETEKIDEHGWSMLLDDRNVKDWLLEDSLKIVSDFLHSMPCNSWVTKIRRNKGFQS